MFGFGLSGKYLLLALALAVPLGACSKKEASLEADPLSTASTSKAGIPTTGPSFRRTEKLAKQFESDPTDVRTGLAYAASLAELGQKDTQMQVLGTLANRNKDNAEVQSSVGKQMLVLGNLNEASGILARAVALNPENWQSRSALGTVYDQLGRHPEARDQYQQALASKPGDLSVSNNLAMSYALQGQLPVAEKQLRDVMAMPGAKAMPRIRQNLALVVGLQGRFDESEKIAAQDLPPDEVAANLAYLKKMLAQPDTWAQLKDG
jgi:Flp pilus assembly protein TadD